MAAKDSKDPFLRFSWTASLLSDPNLTIRVPPSRVSKSSKEDSLFAETLHTSSTVQSCITAWPTPKPSDTHVPEVTTFATLGTGMDGHPGILHGGIVAALMDEGMGILQYVSYEWSQSGSQIGTGKSVTGPGSFTAYLNVRYLRPVRTNSAVVVVSRFTKREGRKEFIEAEVRQAEGGEEGEVVVCAKGEALFVVPRVKKL